jgi:thioredoxin-like negative regulator of GroEL
MEIFSKLGSTHEKVKDGRRKLSKIMFWTKEN